MTIAIIKNRMLPTLPEMNRLTLKRIFEKKNMTYAEEALLDLGVEYWPKKENLLPEERRQLKIIVQALIDNEDGKFNNMKEMIVKHDLDYRKVFQEGLA